MNKEYPNDSLEPKNGTNYTGKLTPNQIKSSSSLFSHGLQLHKRVLVVDDNSDIMLTVRIGKLGLESDPTMQVYSYDNPVTALLEFKPNFYDLLLIDVNMPMMDGFQLAQKLLQKDLNVRICFMTAGEINMDAAKEVHPLKSIGCFLIRDKTKVRWKYDGSANLDRTCAIHTHSPSITMNKVKHSFFCLPTYSAMD